jgi:excisionase family DNA binding protein
MSAGEQTEMMTVEEVASLLMAHSATILRLLKRGRLPGVRFGHNWRFRRRDIIAWIDDESRASVKRGRLRAHKAR